MRGRQREATSTYKRVSSKDYLNVITKENNSERLQNASSVGKETINPSWKRSLPNILVATLLSFLCGYHLGVVNETLESISLDLGFSGSTLAESLVVSTCLGGAFVGSLFSGWIADGIGRRRAFQLCALPMIIGASMRFVLTFALGAGPVPGLLLPEIFPNRIRAKAMAVCMAVHWVINFNVGLLFLRLVEQIGPQILHTIFGTFCLMAVVFVNRNVVETKGKSLQEIEIAFLPIN